MAKTPLANAINSWRWTWEHERRKHELGPTEQSDWEEYVNNLTMYQVLHQLELHDEYDD